MGGAVAKAVTAGWGIESGARSVLGTVCSISVCVYGRDVCQAGYHGLRDQVTVCFNAILPNHVGARICDVALHQVIPLGEELPVAFREPEALLRAANVGAAVSHYFWAVWAVVQARCSAVEFDFLKLGFAFSSIGGKNC